jgi:hypothetical protein
VLFTDRYRRRARVKVRVRVRIRGRCLDCQERWIEKEGKG